MTKQDIKRDYLWNTIGVFAQNAISPLLLIVITRVNGIYDSGVFSFAFSVAIFFWALGMWGGRTYQVSDAKKEFSSKSYISVRIILSFVMIVGALLFVTVNQYDAMKSAVLLSLVLFKAIESIADVLYGVMQVHGKLYISGKSLIYKSTIGTVVFVLLDIISGNIVLSCIGILVINTLFVLLYDIPNATKLEKLMITPRSLGSHINQAVVIMRRCAPVFLVTILATFSLNIPRYFVDIRHDNEIAYFGIISMPITLVVLVMTFILQPNVVRLAALYEKRDVNSFNRIVKNLVSITILVGLVIVIVVFVAGVQILQILFGIDFNTHKYDLIFMVIGGSLNALVSVFINILIIMRGIKPQLYIFILTNILLAYGCSVIIPKYGLLGGAGLFVVVNLIQFVLLFIVYKLMLRKVKMK